MTAQVVPPLSKPKLRGSGPSLSPGCLSPGSPVPTGWGRPCSSRKHPTSGPHPASGHGALPCWSPQGARPGHSWQHSPLCPTGAEVGSPECPGEGQSQTPPGVEPRPTDIKPLPPSFPAAPTPPPSSTRTPGLSHTHARRPHLPAHPPTACIHMHTHPGTHTPTHAHMCTPPGPHRPEHGAGSHTPSPGTPARPHPPRPHGLLSHTGTLDHTDPLRRPAPLFPWHLRPLRNKQKSPARLSPAQPPPRPGDTHPKAVSALPWARAHRAPARLNAHPPGLAPSERGRGLSHWPARSGHPLPDGPHARGPPPEERGQDIPGQAETQPRMQDWGAGAGAGH